jgi:hypothetical protein
MSRFVTLIGVGLASVALAAPALAHGHEDGFRGGHEFHDRDDHHFGFRGGLYFYEPFYAYPYGLPGVYAYPYASSGYRYFCPAANAFYPAVASCPVQWQLLPTP